MKRKMLFGGILISSLIILTSLTSVVGIQSLQTESKNSSPLFSNRLATMINKDDEEIKSNYLGKGNQLNLFPLKKSLNEDMFNKAMKILSTNPALLNKLFDNMENFPYFRELLNKYDVNKLDVKNYLRIIMDDPSLLSEEMKNILIVVPNDDSPQPRGLSTSNPLGCFIVGLIVLPIITVVVTFVALFFTLRIFTCLNVNDCANEIAQEIFDQLVQELIPA